MTTYYGQPAAGSGVAELIGYMNGVNYPGFVKISSLITKIFGVVLAVSGRLCIGKEGPLCHIGAVWGALVLYMPCIDLKHLQNDETKRIFVAAGASAGVSVAFGAPIGGALFVYELSKPNTFWQFKMIWKVFFSCSVSCFTMSIWVGIETNNFTDWSGAVLKFGDLKDTDVVNIFVLIPCAIVIGIIGGLMGALFININTRVNDIRAKLLLWKWIKPLESFFFAFLTGSFFYWVPYATRRCLTIPKNPDNPDEDNPEIFAKAWCPDETQYDPLASLFWAAEGEIISNLISSTVDTSI
jgi:chloride channel 7